MKRLERIRKFVIEEWNREYAYETSDIAILLSCNNKTARYYLMKMVQEGLLHKIKYHGHTWYILKEQVNDFLDYKCIGLSIL